MKRTLYILFFFLVTVLINKVHAQSPPATPPAPTSSTNTCGNKTLTRTGNPTSAQLWAWQTTANGTNLDYIDATYIATYSGTFYLRAYDTRNDLWSLSSSSVTVTVNPNPPNPTTPSVFNSCGSSVLTRGTPPSGDTWYWQDNNASGTSTSNSSLTYTTSTSNTIYIRAYRNGCWSNSVGAIPSPTPLPAMPPTPLATSNTCGDVTLSFNGTPPSQEQWHWQTSSTGTTRTGTSSYVVSNSGTYYLRAYSLNTDCWSSAAEKYVTVNPIPATPSAPTITNNNGCGTAYLTRVSPPVGITWYWQGNNSNGTSISDSAPTYNISYSDTYYLRARNDASGCWSTNSIGVSVTVYPYPNTPNTPTASAGCGPVTLSFNGTPGANERWYWQMNNGSTDISMGYSNSIQVASSATYYLRTYNITSGCWSVNSSQIAIVYLPIPDVPTTPTITNNNGCGTAYLTRISPPVGITWYWQGNISNGTSISDSAPTYNVSSSGTYYLRARNDASGCWSTNSIGVAVTVYPYPNAPSTPLASAVCGPVTLSFNGTPGANENWYWQMSDGSTDISMGYLSTLPVSTSATYYLRAYNTSTGCWSTTSSQLYYEFKPIPDAPPAPLATAGSFCTSVTLSHNGTPPVNVLWYWQTSGTSSTTALGYSNTRIVSTAANYYLKALHNGGCWSTDNSYINIQLGLQPTITSITGSLSYNIGQSITLKADNDTYSSYLWRFNGNIVSTTSQLPVDHPGEYTVEVTKSLGLGSCTSSSVTVASVLNVDQMNYVMVNAIQKEAVTTVAEISTLPVEDRKRIVTYQGGLGNPLQTISYQTSPAKKDLVAAIEYDGQGRQLKQYLPYVSIAADSRYRPDALLSNNQYTGSEQYNFYQQNNDKIVNDIKPYTLLEVEASPLGRTTAQTGVGDAWYANNKKVQKSYAINLATEGIRIWKVNSSGLPVSTATYGDFQLYVDVTTDENSNQVKTYTDKAGRTIFNMTEAESGLWHKTYYIYDELGRLAFTLSPEGVKNLSGYTPTQAYLDTWAFQYRYDDLGRLIESKIPGAAWMYTVYDLLNRPLLSQNGDQRTRAEWAFVKYDQYGRTVATGFKVISSSTRTSVQTSVDAQTNQYELTNITAVGYTLNRTYPTVVENDLLTISYYDNYNFLGYTGWDAEVHTFAFVPELTNTSYNSAIIGLPTGGKTRVIAASPTTTWLNAVQYYDQYYRPIQIIAENHKGYLDRTTNHYTFSGRLEESKLSHQGSEIVTVLQKFTYDHVNRLTKIYHNINSASTDQLAVQYEYNELGQLVDKKLHNTSGSSFLQSVDYRYSIRGQLSSINNAQLTSDGLLTNDDTDDYFGMEFLYEATESGLSNTPYYNGNISAMKWKGAGTGTAAAGQRSYAYTYDKKDRLKTSTFQAHNGVGWTSESNTLNEQMTYDDNGNIKNLQRNQNQRGLSGLTVTSTPQTIDNLTYTYASATGNQLTKVEDATGLVEGFKNGSNTTTEYVYNSDGSLTQDTNKGISNITYNILGKPRQITFADGRTVVYSYLASGAKLSMAVTMNSITTTTDYVGGFVYENNSLRFFGSPEGRVVKNGSNFEYQYALSDHQGNTRVVFTSATPTPVAPSTNMEAATNTDFQNYTNRVGFDLMDHTDAGATYQYAQKLTGGYNAQVGVAKSYKVYAGDKVKIEAWGKYTNPTSTNSNIAGFASALFAAFGVPAPAGGETGTVSSALNIWGGLVATGNGGTNGSGPKAFVNIIVFDKNYKLLDAAWDGVSPAANQVGATPIVPHDYMMQEYTIKEEGYVFMYVSNESSTLVDMYYDDITMTHTKGNVIQYNEYYPYGLQTANSWTRENSTGNNFLYNGGVELNATSGWYDTFFRGYDPALGRFMQADPLAAASMSWSPYHYAKSDPVTFNDPLGDRESPPRDRNTRGFGMPEGGCGACFAMLNRIFSGQRDLSSYAGSGFYWSDGFGGANFNAGLMSSSAWNSFYHATDNESRERLGISVAFERSQSGEEFFIEWYDGKGNYLDTQPLGKNQFLTQSDPYVEKTQRFRLNAGVGVIGADQEGRVNTVSIASYAMDLTVSVFKAGVFDKDGNLRFVWRAKVSAVSFVSASPGDVITMGRVALVDNGETIGTYSLRPSSGPIIPTYSGQYSYVGERYIDLPYSYGNVQLQFLGAWMIDNMGQRAVPVSLTQPEGLSVSQTVILH